MHAGFKEAVERVLPALVDQLAALEPRTIWFTGHSLGGALTLLAADRVGTARGVSTIGCPRVGNAAFAQAFDQTYHRRSLRYVGNVDIVTHLPPEAFKYAHVAALRQIESNGTISRRAVPDPGYPDLIGDPRHVLETIESLAHGRMRHAPGFLLDHMPRGYVVDLWNDFVRHEG